MFLYFGIENINNCNYAYIQLQRPTIMGSINLFVEPVYSISGKCQLSPKNAKELGLPNGGQVKLTDELSGSYTICPMEIVPDCLDFSIKVANNILSEINFGGIEIKIEPSTGVPAKQNTPVTPQPSTGGDAADFLTDLLGDIATKPVPTNPIHSSQPMNTPQMGGPPPRPMATPSTPAPMMGTPQMGGPPPRPMTTPSTPAPVMGTPQMGGPPPRPMATPSTTAPIMGSPQMGGPPPRPMTPPGMTPPGMTPPGMTPPGMTPPGMTPPGMAPPGMAPPGMTPPGMAPPGMTPPGMAPPGMNPPGMNPPGMVPPGMTPQGFDQLPPPIEMAPPDPYPNRIDIQSLVAQKIGSTILKKRLSPNPLEGKVLLTQGVMDRLKIFPSAIVGWEDPLTRATGSARASLGGSSDSEIIMDETTIFDTDIKSDSIVVYSLEPPIVQVESVSLEIESIPELNGFIEISHRQAASLGVSEKDILAFEDELTGAFGAGRLRLNEKVPQNKVYIDKELLDASGVGSLEVAIRKNVRPIIPLQSIDIGIQPITGEKIWEIITMARSNIDIIRQWMANFIIFKGIKLRWQTANVAIEVLNSVPDLTGDVLATVTPNTTLVLKPTGMVTFNAILIIDISRSMMARDVEVINIGPALEGIKAAMHNPEVQDFLKKFKPGTQVPRRLAAAFGAILFLSEKVGRGFGEKVSIIRFADDAQILPMSGGRTYMDSSSGQKGELEECAKTIVREIGDFYGQATNMGPAIGKAQELLNTFNQLNPEQPTMIVLLTDGVPTDGDAFFQGVQALSANPNIVLYIIGLGNPDDEAMKKAAALCGGEYFKPKDSGELLVWYSKRARDLQVKIKRTK
jgi:hypothetical protein